LIGSSLWMRRSVTAQNGKRRRKQRKGGSVVSLVIHLARRG
jgi:hypothetical protein